MTLTKSRRIWITAGAAVLIAGVVGGAFLSAHLAQKSREDQFITAIRDDPTAHLREVPDAQLARGFQSRCEDISDGRTLDDEIAAAHVNWTAIEDASPVTLEQYLANVKAIYRAAEANC